jgi:hypothetical protein
MELFTFLRTRNSQLSIRLLRTFKRLVKRKLSPRKLFERSRKD